MYLYTAWLLKKIKYKSNTDNIAVPSVQLQQLLNSKQDTQNCITNMTNFYFGINLSLIYANGKYIWQVNQYFLLQYLFEPC